MCGRCSGRPKCGERGVIYCAQNVDGYTQNDARYDKRRQAVSWDYLVKSF